MKKLLAILGVWMLILGGCSARTKPRVLIFDVEAEHRAALINLKDGKECLVRGYRLEEKDKLLITHFENCEGIKLERKLDQREIRHWR